MLFRARNFTFTDLFQYSGLQKLDHEFLKELASYDYSLYCDLITYRNKQPLTTQSHSDFIIKLSKFLEIFLIQLFDISIEYTVAQSPILDNIKIFSFKKYYILKKARTRLHLETVLDFNAIHMWLFEEVKRYFFVDKDLELAVAKLGLYYLEDQNVFAEQIENLINWCACVLKNLDAHAELKLWMIFALPKPINCDELIAVKSSVEIKQELDDNLRHRDGFALTDEGMSLRAAHNQINNCMFCHKHNGDYCSKGFPVAKGSSEYAHNVLGEQLIGCPLDIKISEMLLLNGSGNIIAPLAILMLDNPMCPLTGHRICNDCMKSCIYQKLEPVDVPQIESRILKDVLNLKWGFEIYDLLTRWNPLLQSTWLLQPYNGNKVLIIGAGPAGITMAHYLLLQGCLVVMMDGLKVEDLPAHYLESPIEKYSQLIEPLDQRITYGFGGVAEYGITARWDKNLLKVAYISLRRKQYLQIFGGVRFGGSITVDSAWKHGFDHLVIAVGAGLPKELSFPGGHALGIRHANDFLMSLHLTGLNKKNILDVIQLRLPAVVIGGGLTAVDTATEVQAYYLQLVEKVLVMCESLIAIGINPEQTIAAQDWEIIQEWLEHGRELRKERFDATYSNRSPDLIKLLRKWGGVTIAYRKHMHESPAYKRNHDELNKALQEGIYYLENFVPKEAISNKSGHVEFLKGDLLGKGIVLRSNSIFIATGTKPNIAYEFEHRNTFETESCEYKSFTYQDEKLQYTDVSSLHIKMENIGMFTSYNKEDKKVTYIGDAHPLFHGNVVKAVASAKYAASSIMQILNSHDKPRDYSEDPESFMDYLQSQYSCEVMHMALVNKNLLNISIKAPQIVQMFAPGQFYRLQAFETYLINMAVREKCIGKAISVIPSAVDVNDGIIHFHISLHGFHTSFLSYLKQGARVSLMGPTGAKLKIPTNETVVIFGDHVSLSLMCTLGPALKANGNKVLYIASLKIVDEYWYHDWNLVADKVVWFSSQEMSLNLYGYKISQDIFDVFNRTNNLQELVKLVNFDQELIALMQSANRVIVYGESTWTKKVNQFIDDHVHHMFINKPIRFSSVTGPMQCMLKGICGQCLQWQIDPVTRERTKAVFACSWQCQPTEIIDFEHLEQRGAQNEAIERLQQLWFTKIVGNKSNKVTSELTTIINCH